MTTDDDFDELEGQLGELRSNAEAWARMAIAERVAILEELRSSVGANAERWVTASATHKLIPAGSQLVGEEWLSGPYAVLTAISQLIDTLRAIDDGTHLADLQTRRLPNGQLAVRVIPSSTWDRLLTNGTTADVWLLPGATEASVVDRAAAAYRTPVEDRRGRVAVVLGAGNVSSIAPLDSLHKLFSELAVVIVKLNPVNDYLAPIFRNALEPLIRRGFLHIVAGNGDVGEFLCTHEQVDEIHITGSARTHDLIVWGIGDDGAANKAAGMPRNTKPITSELGAVCPTIVVPGSWSDRDVEFQAEHVTTQKLQNNGHNCVACQTLIVDEDWDRSTGFTSAVEAAITAAPPRGVYYPGTFERISAFTDKADTWNNVSDTDSTPRIVAHLDPDGVNASEVFGPALGIRTLREPDPEAFLRRAIDYCNDELEGTLGANVLIHPSTLTELGDRFELLLADLRYGTIAVNAWTGVGFGLTQTPWGAFPGHTLDDVGSGIGFVHNTNMLVDVERTVLTMPFAPFPAGLRSRSFSLMPKPPFFVTHRRADVVGRLLTRFAARPSPRKIPAILLNALRG